MIARAVHTLYHTYSVVNKEPAAKQVSQLLALTKNCVKRIDNNEFTRQMFACAYLFGDIGLPAHKRTRPHEAK